MGKALVLENLLDEGVGRRAVDHALRAVEPNLVAAVSVDAHELEVDRDLGVGVVGRAHHAERGLDGLVDQTLKLGVIRVGLGKCRVLLVGERALHGNERVGLRLGYAQRLVRDD